MSTPQTNDLVAPAMNAETLKALHGSIAKWAGIVVGTVRNEGTANCPLCKAFHADCCRGCPVVEATGSTGCRNTPYADYSDEEELGDDADREKLKALAQDEVDFLKSLLPPESLTALEQNRG